jgi:hypothetical protein
VLIVYYVYNIKDIARLPHISPCPELTRATSEYAYASRLGVGAYATRVTAKLPIQRAGMQLRRRIRVAFPLL